MKTHLTSFLLIMLSLSASAQKVWTEGTTWEVEYIAEANQPNVTYALVSSTELDGVSYFPLTETIAEECDTIAYIRSERGDSLVYARVLYDGEWLPETLLYEFTKSYEYGDYIRYGTLYGMLQSFIFQEDGTLQYLYDILEEGDCLPVWDGIIYKLGHVEGPLYLFFHPEDILEGSTPKPTNVSHILFRTKGGVRKMISICCGANPIDSVGTKQREAVIYDILGRKLPGIPQSGLYILDGRVLVK